MGRVNPLIALGINLFMGQLGIEETTEEQQAKPAIPEISEIRPVQRLAKRDGAIITILGRPYIGKTVLAYRLAECFQRPTYSVSPEQSPPKWVEEIKFEEVAKKPPPVSTLILDDSLGYMDSRSYQDTFVQVVEHVVPAARHKRKLIVIFIAQTSGLLDKYGLRSDLICLKAPDLLYEDLERTSVKKLQDRAAEIWKGKSERWLQRHSYVVAPDFEGVVRVDKYDETGQGLDRFINPAPSSP